MFFLCRSLSFATFILAVFASMLIFTFHLRPFTIQISVNAVNKGAKRDDVCDNISFILLALFQPLFFVENTNTHFVILFNVIQSDGTA